MGKRFRRWEPGQGLLRPPSVDDFVPQEHPARLVRDLVQNELDLSAILDAYQGTRGQGAKGRFALAFPLSSPSSTVAVLRT